MYLQRWVLFGLIIGLISGIGAIFFYLLLDYSNNFFLGYLGNFYAPLPSGEGESFYDVENYKIFFPLIPMIGGLISGIIIFKLAPEAEGHGTDAVISSFHNFSGVIRKRIPLIKSIASAFTIGSGGSAGREGPIAQIGAGFGSWFATRLKLSDRERRMMLVCGAAAGIGSIFKAPFGAAIFALEVLYKRDFEVDALVPSFVSSIVAYSVFSSVFGFKKIFEIPEYHISNPINFIFYLFLGVLCGLIAIIYTQSFYGLRNSFKKLQIPNYLKPAIGGLVLGVMALFLPQVIGSGYGWLQLAIYGKITISLMLIITFSKIVATSFSVGSGGSGGVFAPSLVIGGMLGGVFGEFLNVFFPSFIDVASAFVLVGMAAFFAGAGKVPIAAMLMVSEMTGGYNLLVPLMAACSISYIITGKYSIYESQVQTRVDSPAHRGEFRIDILEEIPVEKVMTKKVVTVTTKTPLIEVSKLVGSTGHIGYPVIDKGKIVGIVSYSDILKVPAEKSSEMKVKDVMSDRIITAFPQESLDFALRKMDEYGIGRLPVVDPKDPQKIVGILSKRDLIKGHELAKHEGLAELHREMLDLVKVKEVMRSDIIPIDGDLTIKEFLKHMTRYPHRSHPVLDEGKLIGILNIDKVLRRLASNKDDVIREIIDDRLIVTYPDETMHEALNKMYKNKVICLPVVDKSRKWKILGMITESEIIRAHELERFTQ